MDILAYLMASEWGQYIVAATAVIGGIVTIASAIVPLTSTPKDDEFLAKVKGFLQRFSVLKPKQ